MPVQARESNVVVLELQAQSEPSVCRQRHIERRLNDLGADAVAGQHENLHGLAPSRGATEAPWIPCRASAFATKPLAFGSTGKSLNWMRIIPPP